MAEPHAPGVAPATPGASGSGSGSVSGSGSGSGSAWPARPGVRLAAAVMVPFWAVLPGMGLIDLQVMFVPDSFYADSVGLMVSWGVFFTVLVGLPFAWAAARPHQVLPVVVLLGVCAASLFAGAALGMQWEPAVVAALVILTALPLLPSALRHARHEGLRLRVRPALLGLVALSVPFSALYAASAFRTARTDPSPEAWRTNGVDHWPVQGTLGIAVILALLVMAVWPRAATVFRAVLSLALATMALCWAMYPDTVGSVDSQLFAAGTLLVAVLVALASPSPELAGPGPGEPQHPRRRR